MPILILVAACVVLVIAMTGSYSRGLQRGRDEGWRQVERSTDEWYDKGYSDGNRRLHQPKDEKTGRFTRR